MIEIALAAAALLLGWAAQLLLALRAASKSAGGAVNPLRWMRKRPYQVALGIVGGLLGFVVLYSTDQLTAIAAFSAGYLGQDVIEKVASGADNQFSKAG